MAQQRWILADGGADAVEDRLGKARLLPCVAQTVFFLGIADEGGLNENRRNSLGLEHGEFGVFNARLVQGPELGEFA